MRITRFYHPTILSAISAISALLLCVALVSAQEQDKKEQKEEQETTIRFDTDLVSVDITVTDRKGNRTVTGLKASDFVIYEDGVRQKISNFSTADVPFSLALMIDTSASTRDELPLIRSSARRFIDDLRLQDRIALVQFNKEIEITTPLTSDRFKLETGLNRLRLGSGTSFYDAMQSAIRDALKVAGRKAIVVLTDGVDSFGTSTFDQVMPELERAGASVYFLELNTESFTEAGMVRACTDREHFRFSAKQLKKYVKEYLPGGDEADYENHCSLSALERIQINGRLFQSARRELREIARRTGGRVYQIKGLSDLEPAYKQIAAELGTQYSLAYYPTNEKHDGKWRTLRVEIKRPGLAVQSKPGYRAPKD
jgi:Ca-activated chloride channel family protein